MAWQSPSAMSGGGGFVGPGGDANGGPQGTEYTLQGRFLVRKKLVSSFLSNDPIRNANYSLIC